MVYMLPKYFGMRDPPFATTLVPATVADQVVVPEAASFVTEPHDTTVGGHLHRQNTRPTTTEANIVISGQTKTWVQKETRLDPEQEKLRAVSDAILNDLNHNQQQNAQCLDGHPEALPAQQRLPVHTRLGNPPLTIHRIMFKIEDRQFGSGFKDPINKEALNKEQSEQNLSMTESGIMLFIKSSLPCH
ncbi:OLC1v1031034C1 [Oldenlandia corymbosa var. corymbosa]|uniref:OLC1v1031034C1 n=1 Tax=Oldenlandia corymbosa var. corymbosa TaxID=529605 RepID=A0AAV1CI30_OLDCO|nr:OLC1v1031034C1 [Oldenlandia corymbosa var. corymbosa]